jgi:hypothetical protein
MLEYSKLILEKVSFDNKLFEKELIKSINILMPEEIKELLSWVSANFSHQHPDIISNFHLLL